MNYTLITGASSGIGYEFAKVFANNNHNLVLTAPDKKKLIMLKVLLEKLYNIKVEIIALDLTNEEDINKLYNFTKEKNIKVDILVNNAGFGYHSIFINSNYNTQSNLIKLNILALMKLTYLYGSDMKERKQGKILNVSSLSSFMPGPYMATYYASKSFVLSFSKSISEELKEYKIHVTTLCPPPTNTNFEDYAYLNDSYMFKLFIPANPENVAKYGYKMLYENKTLAYYGPYTKLGNILSRILPITITTKIAKFINQKPRLEN